MKANHSISIIETFARHRVAPNLLMVLLIMAGVWGVFNINIQNLPTVEIKALTISIDWPGASAEDVAKAISSPVEQELQDLESLKQVKSISVQGNSLIFTEFTSEANLDDVMNDVRERVNRVRNLPATAEKPIIKQIELLEPIVKIVITGPEDLEALRPLAHKFKRELLQRGISKVEMIGLPTNELAIQVPMLELAELKKNLPQIADIIGNKSEDFPAGTIGKSEFGQRLRSIEQKRNIEQFTQLNFLSPTGQKIKLGDIAEISYRAREGQPLVEYADKPAVELRLLRTKSANSLTMANVSNQWLEEKRELYGDSLQFVVYDETWLLIKERINLLVKNGIGGLLLIVVVLFLLLNRQVAFWVCVGIPVSFMASVGVLYAFGDSLNMISLFTLILVLGIIVDDTIVIGEQAMSNLHDGMSPLQSAVRSAQKMLVPILASSLTTIFAFLPLFLIGGVIGEVIFSIPLVIVCAILASLVECFWIMPGHLYLSFKKQGEVAQLKVRMFVNHKLEYFKHKQFRGLLVKVMRHKLITVLSVLFAFGLSLFLLFAGYVNFNFFPTPDGKIVTARVSYLIGTPEQEIKRFVRQSIEKLYEAEREISPEQKFIETVIVHYNYAAFDPYIPNVGENYAEINVEMLSPEYRNVSDNEVIEAWNKAITLPPYVENMSIDKLRFGPPGEDIDIQVAGNSVEDLKNASEAIQQYLKNVPGVYNIRDSMPMGQEQVIFDINPVGESLGLTILDVGNQLQAAFRGKVAEIFYDENEEIEVRVILPDIERKDRQAIERFPIITPAGEVVPLSSVIDLSYRYGPEEIIHRDLAQVVNVRAAVNAEHANANKVLQKIDTTFIPELKAQYPIEVSYRGKAQEQDETFTDMNQGLIIGMLLIYITLAWVFQSYIWPLVVMLAIPLGLIGAIIGHIIMGIDLSIMSLFGMFGLAGIVVNDSIILLNEYRLSRGQSMSVNAAIINACQVRLRPVLLTSLTTIAGLTPLLFETSQQSMFLIPMVASLVFGLAFSTLLILIFIPAFISLLESKSLKQ
jgi:multidrug efflux pump subunit AcrB